MANSIKNIRSGFVQAQFNEPLAKLLSYELAYAAIAGSIGWQYYGGGSGYSGGYF